MSQDHIGHGMARVSSASRTGRARASQRPSRASAAASTGAPAQEQPSSPSSQAKQRRHSSLSPRAKQPALNSGSATSVLPNASSAPSSAPFSLGLKRRQLNGPQSCLGMCVRMVTVSFVLFFFILLTSVDLIAKGIMLHQRNATSLSSLAAVRSLAMGELAELRGTILAVPAPSGPTSAGKAADVAEEHAQASEEGEGVNEADPGDGQGGVTSGAAQRAQAAQEGGALVDPLPQEFRERRVRAWVGEADGDGGDRVDALLEERVHAALNVVHQRQGALNRQRFQLHLLVHGECDVGALEGLLESLRAVQYGGDKVHITVAAPCEDSLHAVHALHWVHGSKRGVNLGGHNGSVSVTSALQLWQPQSSAEFLFILGLKSRVSRGFYSALKSMALETIQQYGGEEAELAGPNEGPTRPQTVAKEGEDDLSTESESGESSAAARRLLASADRSQGAGGGSLGIVSEAVNSGAGSQGPGARRVLQTRGASANKEGPRAEPRGLVSFFGILLDPEAPKLGQESPYLMGARSPPVVEARRAAQESAQGQSTTSAAAEMRSFSSNALGSACQLVFPGPWHRFWRWHEAVQAPQQDSADLVYDWDAYDFSQPCRHDWQLSLLTFMGETNRLNLVMLPLQDGSQLCQAAPLSSPGATTGSDTLPSVPLATASSAEKLPGDFLLPQGKGDREEESLSIPRFDQCGREVPRGAVAENTLELKPLLERLSRQSAVVGVMVSPGYDDMLNNWLCYVKELQIHNFFIITQDSRHALALAKRGLAVYCAGCRERAKAQGAKGQESEAVPLNYGSTEYKEFILARTRAVGDILKAGYNVLLADVDAAWMADPFAFFKPEGVDILAQLEERGNPCGGFLLLVHTPRLIVLWDLLTAMFEEHIEWTKTHPSRSNPAEYAKFLEKQKHSHEQKFLADLLKQKRHKVKLQGLDPLLFINGRDYWDRRKAQKRGVVPVMIHNNYVVSKQNKTRRFRIKGMWRVDTSGAACKCLAVSCMQPKDPWYLADVNGTALAAHTHTVPTLAQFLTALSAGGNASVSAWKERERKGEEAPPQEQEVRKVRKKLPRRRHGGMLQLAKDTEALVKKLVKGRGKRKGKGEGEERQEGKQADEEEGSSGGGKEAEAGPGKRKDEGTVKESHDKAGEEEMEVDKGVLAGPALDKGDGSAKHGRVGGGGGSEEQGGADQKQRAKANQSLATLDSRAGGGEDETARKGEGKQGKSEEAESKQQENSGAKEVGDIDSVESSSTMKGPGEKAMEKAGSTKGKAGEEVTEEAGGGVDKGGSNSASESKDGEKAGSRESTSIGKESSGDGKAKYGKPGHEAAEGDTSASTGEGSSDRMDAKGVVRERKGKEEKSSHPDVVSKGGRARKPDKKKNKVTRRKKN